MVEELAEVVYTKTLGSRKNLKEAMTSPLRHNVSIADRVRAKLQKAFPIFSESRDAASFRGDCKTNIFT